jgi:hypothetical protein
VSFLHSVQFLAALDNSNIQWHSHALMRMLERGISRRSVMEVLRCGKAIEEYPSDHPYPSTLVLGYSDELPLHVVVAFDSEHKTIFIVTAYRPDLKHFKDDYQTRR